MTVSSRYTDAANQFIAANGTRLATRELGPRGGVPLVLLNHWGATLDNFDPAIVDGLATHRLICWAFRWAALWRRTLC